VPTVTIPCGLASGGLPCGLQLIGPAGREDLLLEVAQWCESTLEFNEEPST
jgi:Asp-tRNA(Asn)/Glu-tRNA(Gln) amidotransferase A subunit family amidase